jgi:hypothetical protein
MNKSIINNVVLFFSCIILSSCSALVLVESFKSDSKDNAWITDDKSDYSPYCYRSNGVIFEVYTNPRRVVEREGPILLPISLTDNEDIDKYAFRVELCIKTDSQNITLNPQEMRIFFNQADSLIPESISHSKYRDSSRLYRPIKKYFKEYLFSFDMPYAKMEKFRISFPEVCIGGSTVQLPALQLVKHTRREYYPMTCR